MLATSLVSLGDVRCPVCDKATQPISAQKDDLSKPSKNMDVWNRSSCANLSYGDGSYICMEDGYAFESSFKTWNLTLSDPKGFAHPLVTSIASFPLPPEPKLTNWFYSQEFKSLRSVADTVQFWCVTDVVYFEKIKEYAKNNQLTLTIENMERDGRYKGESMVIVTKKTEQAAPSNGDKPSK